MQLINEVTQRKLWSRLFQAVGKKMIIINIDYMGLGNRLKLLATYDWYWGLDDTTLLWNREGWVSCRLDDIIEIEGVRNWREHSVPLNRFLPPTMCSPEKPEFWPRGYWRFHVDEPLDPEFLITRRGKTFPAVDLIYERTPPQFIERYRPFFARLKPTPAVAARIAEVDVGLQDVCVQIRNTVDPKDHARVPQLDELVERLRAYPERTRFFISALDSRFSRVLTDALGERAFELPSKNYRSMIDATADMFLLGRGTELLVSDGSTFGEVAWWLGGCQARVVRLQSS